MKNTSLNALNTLIFLAFLLFTRDIVVFYLSTLQNQFDNKLTYANDISTYSAIIIAGLTFYLLYKFTFSNKVLLFALYFLILKSLFIIFTYFQKEYNFLMLNDKNVLDFDRLTKKSLIVSSSISFLISCYILYYIYYGF